MLLNIDIRTVIVLLGITSIIQVIAFLLQYLVNKSSRSAVWWLIGFAFIATGMALSLLRDVIDLKVITIFASNIFQILGPIFIYIGVMRFLSKEENYSFVFLVFLVWLPFFFYFAFVNDQINMRSIISSVALAAIAFMTALGFLRNIISTINISATFNLLAFFIQGCFWIFRIIELLTFSPVQEYFSPTLIQVSTYIFVLIISLVETFGLIIMVNHRLNTEITEAKNHFEAIFNTSPDAVLITRLSDGQFININDGFSTMTGFTHAEILGKSILDVNIWKDPSDRQKLVTKLNEKGYCENLQADFQRKDGSQLTALVSARLIFLQTAPHIISVVRDITERKLAEEALKESQSLYLAVIENQTDPVCRWLPDTTLTFINSSYCKYFGKSKEQLLGTRFISSLPHETQEDIRNAIDSMIRQELSSISIEEKNNDSQGNQRWMVWAYKPNTGKNGEIIDFQSVGRDITDRKNLEEKLIHQATTDELTGISNRRYFMEMTSIELKRSIRFDRPLALLMMDLDHLKRINDTYGHAAGDQALMAFVKICSENIREIDIIARFGGDEFVLLLPETNCELAFEVAHRLRLTLAAQPLDCAGTPVMVTSSVGVSCLKNDKETLETLLARADKSLYQAKEAGRNCVICCAGEENDSNPIHNN